MERTLENAHVTLGLSDTASRVAQFICDDPAITGLTAEYLGNDGKIYTLKAEVTRRTKISVYVDILAEWEREFPITHAGISSINFHRVQPRRLFHL